MSDPSIQSRIDSIKEWVENNKALLVTSNKAEIIINVAGKEIKGKITVYPEK